MNDMHLPPLAEHAEPADGLPAETVARLNARLIEQTDTLDNLFLGLAGHAENRMASFPGMAQIYVRLALRAQSNYRASVAVLLKADREARRAQEAVAE